jgi:NifU-like protein involved in Fe-S cluster formation
MEAPDVVGRAGEPGNGSPFMLLFLRLEGERIAQASFQTYGCGPAIATGSLLAERLTGAAIATLGAWTDEAIATALGGLPDEKRHCSRLGAEAVASATAQLRAREGAR